MSVSVSRYAAVIPAYNEAGTIGDVVARTLVFVPHVIVIDDGSSDGTADLLRELPVTLLRHARNLGKAAALWHGMQQAIDHGASAVITLDGDGQHEPESIPALIALHRRAPQALIIGSRLHDAHVIPLKRYLANRVANFWMSWAAGQPIADSQSGFRLYPTTLLSSLALSCDRTKGFVFESELLIEAGRQGIQIRSIPVSAIYGRHLRRSHFRQVRDITRITRMVARKLLARRLDLPALIRSRRPQPAPAAAVIHDADAHPPMEPRRRLLFFAEAVSLAHVARAVALAQSLDRTRYEIHLACDGRYRSLFEGLPFPVHSIRSIGSDQFQDRLMKGDPLYSVSEVREYAKEDLRVIASVNPSVVVSDFRLSLSISARAAGIPFITVTNAHWSPYARPRFIVPELAITARFGPRAGQVLFNLMRPFVFAHHARALNKVRREYGLPPVGYSLPQMFADADQTVYADLPELVPTVRLPSHHYYIGPVLWSPDARPSWWNDLPEDRSLVYVNLGSSGRNELLPNVLQALQDLGIGAMVSTAGRGFPEVVPGHVWISEYIPGLQAAARAELVICNGGSATVYQALAAGVPVLGIPSNLDQYLMMDYVEKFGAGAMVRGGQASSAALRDMAQRVLNIAQYRSRAESLAVVIKSGQWADRFETLVDHLFEPNERREGVAALGQAGRGNRSTAAQDLEQPGQRQDARQMPDMRC
jgi:UDP:flavonoid glycosyltransferase YjiC (YdhE family)